MAANDAEVVVVLDRTHANSDLADRVARQHTVAVADIKSFGPAAYPACHLFLFDVALSGQASLKRLRGLVGVPAYERSARVFILDTHNRGEVVRTFELGATDYLVRPVDDEALNPMIAKLMTESVERSWEALNDI